MTFSITTILFLGAAQGTLLSLVLLTVRRGNRVANRILAATLLLFSLDIFLHTLPHTEYPYSHPYHAEIIVFLFLLITPLIYLYVEALTRDEFRFTAKTLRHFLPFAILILLFLTFQVRSGEHSTDDIHITPFNLILGFAALVQVMVYVPAALRILRQHGRDIQTSFSSLEKINLNWLRALVLAYAGTWLVMVVAFSLAGHWGTSRTGEYLTVLLSVEMYAIGYLGLRQPAIFSGIEPSPDEPERYAKSTLTQDMADTYLQKLQQKMETDKPHLENNLTLSGLADQLAMSSHHLSQILNERLEQNFFEFVNRHRVQEAQAMLIDPANQHLNIATIGFDAGFNSVSAFNAAFKKHTRMTPSQYKKSQNPA